MTHSFRGVNAGLVYGILLFLSWIASDPEPVLLKLFDDVFEPLEFWAQGTMSLTTVFGCIAYRSAKKRKLGLVTNLKIRKYIEIALLVISVYVAGFVRRALKASGLSWEQVLFEETGLILMPSITLCWVVVGISTSRGNRRYYGPTWTIVAAIETL